MRRTLVTGATGFVGANLARRLLRDGHEVHLLVRPGHTGWRIAEIRDAVAVHEVDLLDPDATARVVGTIRPEWVFHLAAHGAYSWQRAAEPIIATNLTALVHLLEACTKTGFAAFVNTGSSSEYGYKDHAAVEDERIEPNSLYAVTKAAATHYCRHVAQRDQVAVPTLRLYSVYGPYEEPNRLMPQLIVQGRRGGYPPLVHPDVARDYVHVDDVCEAYVRAAERPGADPGAIYNVGSGVQTTLREIVAIAARVLGIAAAPPWGGMERRAWDTHTWVADIGKIARELDWRPRLSVEQGFRAMADWFAERYDDDALAAYCAASHAPPLARETG
jgi:nucleoside-diphosphate-sugar epimerase